MNKSLRLLAGLIAVVVAVAAPAAALGLLNLDTKGNANARASADAGADGGHAGGSASADASADASISADGVRSDLVDDARGRVPQGLDALDAGACDAVPKLELNVGLGACDVRAKAEGVKNGLEGALDDPEAALDDARAEVETIKGDAGQGNWQKLVLRMQAMVKAVLG
ncbi:MAG TPA: hypothetical protein VM582_03005 [Candidatus Thermoplasmatota archaeon]|nr:hypothetical protein [Candidatus Thermoplasmatota archaeon]